MRQSKTFSDCRIHTSSWEDEDTQALLEVLDAQEVKATFFVVGEWAERCSDSVRALHQAGHEIMNHSATHPHLSQCSREELIRQVEEGGERIAALTGETPTLFRCPYGEYNDQIITTVRSLGVTPVQWDVDVLERVGVIFLACITIQNAALFFDNVTISPFSSAVKAWDTRSGVRAFRLGQVSLSPLAQPPSFCYTNPETDVLL